MEHENMNAVDLLAQARRVGIRIQASGADLKLEADRPPPPELIKALADKKGEVLAALRDASGEWAAGDWRMYFEERAAIRENDGGLARAEAERGAFDDAVIMWMNRNPVVSAADACVGCGRPDRQGSVLLPFGASAAGRAWLHSECWEPWRERRVATAAAALKAAGIECPAVPRLRSA
jgi:hypothetical protein